MPTFQFERVLNLLFIKNKISDLHFVLRIMCKIPCKQNKM